MPSSSGYPHKTKSVFSDIQDGQQTFFTNYIFKNGSEEDKKLLQNHMKKKLTQTQIKSLQDMFEKAWALDYGKNLIKEHTQKAAEIREKINFQDPVAAKDLQALIHKIADLKI